MNFVIVSIINKRYYSFLEFERLKRSINNLLELEYVDYESIYWDDEGELIFTPPLHKMDKSYWINVLNSYVDKDKWEFTNGKHF